MSGKKLEKGQIIIEAIIALASLLILIAAIAVVITTSLANSTFSSNQDMANKHAQEAIESIRNLAQSNATFQVGSQDSTVFNLQGASFCMGDDGQISLAQNVGAGTPRDGCGVNVANSFVRTIEFVQNTCGGSPFNGVEVTTRVAWSSGKCTCPDTATCTISERYCHDAQLVSCFKKPQNNLNP